MKYRFVLFICLILIFFQFTVASQSPTKYTFDLLPGQIFDNDTAFVNSTRFWDTITLGSLDDANSVQFNNIGGTLTIDEAHLGLLFCELTGCTMAGDINMNGNDLLNVNDITQTGKITITSTGAGTQRVINSSSTNPNGVIGYQLNNDVGASIALSLAGSGIADFANDSGIITRGGRTFIVNAAGEEIIMGHGDLSLGVNFSWTLESDGAVTQTGPLVMNGSKIFLDGVRDHFITTNIDGFPFNGIAQNATWFGHDFMRDDGEITYLFTWENNTQLWLQAGRNNSFSAIGNSFGLVPQYMAEENFTENGVINMTKASDYIFLCNLFDVDCSFNADTRGNAIDLIPGGPLLWTMGDAEIWQSLKVHKGIAVQGPAVFDLKGNDANFNNGSVHIATLVTFQQGFDAGDSVTKFTETFASTLGIFTNLQVDLGDWVSVLSTTFCDEGQCAQSDGAGTGFVAMQTNISTLDVNETTFSFVYSLFNMIGSGEISVVVNNNVGSGDVTIFTDTTDNVVQNSQSIPLPSSMDNQSLISITVNCDVASAAKPTRQCYFDTAKLNGTAITTTTINVSGFDSVITFGDGSLAADGFPERGIIYNASGDEIIFRGNATFQNIIEQDLTITSSITLNSSTIFDWADIVNTPLFPEYFLLNGSSLMQGNANWDGFNLSNLDWINGFNMINGSGNIITIGNITGVFGNFNTIDFGANTIVAGFMTGPWNFDSAILTEVNIDSGTINGITGTAMFEGIFASGDILANEFNIDATIAHEITNFQDDNLIIKNLNEGKEIIFSVNMGGTQTPIMTLIGASEQVSIDGTLTVNGESGASAIHSFTSFTATSGNIGYTGVLSSVITVGITGTTSPTLKSFGSNLIAPATSGTTELIGYSSNAGSMEGTGNQTFYHFFGQPSSAPSNSVIVINTGVKTQYGAYLEGGWSNFVGSSNLTQYGIYLKNWNVVSPGTSGSVVSWDMFSESGADWVWNSTDQKLMIGGNQGEFEIFFDGTNPYFNYSNTTSVAYFAGNVSVENLIDRSIYWDKSLGQAFENMYDADTIDSDEDLPDFEKAVYPVTDYDRPEIESYWKTGNLTMELWDKIKNNMNNNVNYKDVIFFEDGNMSVSIEYNRTHYPHKKNETGRLISAVVGKHEQALYELTTNIDLHENLTEFKKDILAEGYITNTTKDSQSLSKIRNLLDNLPEESEWLSGEGKLSNSVLFPKEISDIGSYDLSGVTHYNRLWLVILSQEARENRQRINDLEAENQMMKDEMCIIKPALSWC